jgi:hypothetical protein
MAINIVAVVRPLKSNHASEYDGARISKMACATEPKACMYFISSLKFLKVSNESNTCPRKRRAYAPLTGSEGIIPA